MNGKHTSLMSDVMTNRNLGVAQSDLIKLEDKIHKRSAIEVQECILKHMGSSEESKDAVERVKKIRPKQLNWPSDWWPIIKAFMKIMVFLLLLKVSPIAVDVTTDSLLLAEYAKNSNLTTPNVNMDCDLLVEYINSDIDDINGTMPRNKPSASIGTYENVIIENPIKINIDQNENMTGKNFNVTMDCLLQVAYANSKTVGPNKGMIINHIY